MNRNATFHQSCCEVFLLKSFTVACHEKPLAVLLCETTEQNMHFSSPWGFFVSLPTNPFVGNKSLPWGKTLCVTVSQQCKQPFWAAVPSTTDVTHKSKFTFCMFSAFPRAKGFFFHIDNMLHVHMCACVSICLDMFCVIPNIYTQNKCTTAQISHSIHLRWLLCSDPEQKKFARTHHSVSH